jgi:hypothetical protein
MPPGRETIPHASIDRYKAGTYTTYFSLLISLVPDTSSNFAMAYDEM